MIKIIIKFILVFTFLFLINPVYAQLFDNYDGVGGLTYDSSGTWVINAGQLEAQTAGSSQPEHSFISFDMSTKITAWDLQNSNTNEWIGWMDLNRASVSGWGGGNYSCAFVLACNSNIFNSATAKGYAIGFTDTDLLVLFKFSSGIVSGTTFLPGTSVQILNSQYFYKDTDNGVNIYVKLESTGNWTIKYKAGAQLSDAAAVDPANYSDGSVTSTSADNTYRGTSFKYSGWAYAHSSGSSEKAFFDNFGFSQNNALPVELISFSAQVENGNVLLNWETATEVNNYGFEVERKISSTNFLPNSFEKIGFVEGNGTTNIPHKYFFLDSNPGGVSIIYRLKQIDINGSFEYSDQIEVNLKFSDKPELMQNSPNPFNPSTSIKFYLPFDADITIKVYNIMGIEITTLIHQKQSAGFHLVNWNGRDENGLNVSSGVYLYRLTAISDNSNKFFVQTKKMTLIK